MVLIFPTGINASRDPCKTGQATGQATGQPREPLHLHLHLHSRLVWSGMTHRHSQGMQRICNGYCRSREKNPPHYCCRIGIDRIASHRIAWQTYVPTYCILEYSTDSIGAEEQRSKNIPCKSLHNYLFKLPVYSQSPDCGVRHSILDTYHRPRPRNLPPPLHSAIAHIACFTTPIFLCLWTWCSEWGSTFYTLSGK